ncbi:hypothetical protein Tco_0662680 [Tanacetum coccineum]
MLKKFGLEDSKPTKTPMSTEIKLSKDDEADSVDSSKYRAPPTDPPNTRDGYMVWEIRESHGSFPWDRFEFQKVKMDDPNITMEEYIRIEEEKARRRGKVYNWETATYGKIWYDEDIHDLRSVETEFPAIIFDNALTSKVTLSCEPTVSLKLTLEYRLTNPMMKMTRHFKDLDYFKDFENEFPAIVYNDALTSKLDFLTEPTVSPKHIDEFNLKVETILSECDEEEQNVLYFNDLFPINVIYPDDLKSDTDNDNDEIDIEQPLRDMSVIPLPNAINVNAQGSNKLLETRAPINLIKNLYVPFGIPFDPKLFYKDGIKLGQV